MPNWTAFAGFAAVLVVLFLLLARASQSLLTHDDPAATRRNAPGIPTEPAPHADASRYEATGAEADDSTDDVPGPEADDPTVDASGTEVVDPTDEASGPEAVEPTGPAERPLAEGRPFGTGELLANVLLTHGVVALLVAGTAVLWQIPAGALGATGPVLPAVAWGGLLGVALYALDEVGAAGIDRLGVDHDEALRALLAPASPAGWVLLLGGVLPAIAVGEELLFRGVLVGAYAAGFALPAWGLAVVSSAAFAVGHGAQGRGGIVVTGLLGFALAAAFVVSGSLLLVVVAHYVVNALEFVVHEGLGVEWATSTGGE